MMKKCFVAVLALVLVMGISSCNSGALVFNNKVVEVQQSLEPKILDFGNKMQGVGESGDIKSLTPTAKQLIVDLDNGIAKIKAIEAPKDGEEFKRSLLAQLEFMKKLCNQTIKLGDDATTDQEKLTIAEEFMKAEDEAKRLEEDTKVKQQAFAKANNFKLEQK